VVTCLETTAEDILEEVPGARKKRKKEARRRLKRSVGSETKLQLKETPCRRWRRWRWKWWKRLEKLMLVVP
jgi:hypothetical protein